MTDLEFKNKKVAFIKQCCIFAGLPGFWVIDAKLGNDGYRYFHIKCEKDQIEIVWDIYMGASLVSINRYGEHAGSALSAYSLSKILTFMNLLDKGEQAKGPALDAGLCAVY